MSVAFYADQNVPWPVVAGLRRRGVNVLTAQGVGHHRAGDPAVLDRAGGLGRVLVTCDKDFEIEGHARQATGRWFVGVLKAVQNDMHHRPGRYVDDLELIAQAAEPVDYENRVEYLPLRPP
ncbi:MAG: DUF5615 family PIN-like protein [Gemmataceae bacterium]|nr:DUF5615 family PIN-like protein [Gemmataceae bacterium]